MSMAITRATGQGRSWGFSLSAGTVGDFGEVKYGIKYFLPLNVTTQFFSFIL